MPCAVQAGVTVFCRGKYASDADVKLVDELLLTTGECEQYHLTKNAINFRCKRTHLINLSGYIQLRKNPLQRLNSMAANPQELRNLVNLQ